jgi:hypothetical protein
LFDCRLVIDKIDLIILSEINVTTEEGSIYGIPGFESILKCRLSGKGEELLCTKENI